MKVLHVITGLGLGGAEKLVLDLSKESKRDDLAGFVVASLTEELTRLSSFQNEDIHVFRLKMSHSLASVFRAINMLKEIVRSQEVKVIHAHMYHAGVISTLYKLFYGLKMPLVFTVHNTNIKGRSRELILRLGRNLRNADVIFSKEQQQFYHCHNLKVIPNGLDFDQIRSDGSERKKYDVFTFVNVGNIEQQKNQIQLLDAAKSLKLTRQDFQILFIGEGSLKNSLQYQIEKQNLSGHVKLLGARDDVPEILSRSHCFVLSSLWEGMPISVLEAAAVGLPVISTAVGKLQELLANERGRLVDVTQIAAAMLAIMMDCEAGKMHGSKLQKYVLQNFSIKLCYQRHLELYDSLAQD